MGICQDYLLQTRPSKQTITDFPGCRVISSHPLKYTKSKQGLRVEHAKICQPQVIIFVLPAFQKNKAYFLVKAY
jgi:hypothetical protein